MLLLQGETFITAQLLRQLQTIQTHYELEYSMDEFLLSRCWGNHKYYTLKRDNTTRVVWLVGTPPTSRQSRKLNKMLQ